MREIILVIGLAMCVILFLISEEFRDFTKVALLGYIAYRLYTIWMIMK